MASLYKETNGSWKLQFTTPDKKRRSLRLGKLPKRDAESVKQHVEAIIGSALAGGSPPDSTCQWLRRLNDTLYDKLAAVGIVNARQRGLLGAFLDAYFEKRTDVKAGTRLVWSHAKRNLLEYFDADKPLQEVTAGDAEDFRRWLLSDDGQALHETTTGKRLQVVRQFFEDAFKHELTTTQPVRQRESWQHRQPNA